MNAVSAVQTFLIPCGGEYEPSALVLARLLAWQCKIGREDDDEFLERVLWNQTGYPMFWDGAPVECCARQLRDFFEGRFHCDRCGVDVEAVGLCPECETEMSDA